MEDALGPALSSGDEQEIQERVKRLVPLAKDVVLVLVKTIKATRMYLPNNPIYKKFREELKVKFDLFFADEDMLSFRVKSFELEFLEQQVYQNPDKEDNIALMFYKDGIREFCFHKGIDPEEIEGFIDILKADTRERELDDDLVTMMWEKDFEHISYTATEDATDDEALEEKLLLDFRDEPDAVRRLEELRSRAIQEAQGAPGGTSGSTAAGGAGLPTAAPINAIPDLPDEGDGGEAARGSYNAPDDLRLLIELTDIFYEILITEKDMGHFEMVADSLTKALELFVNRGDMALATILVMKVQELAGADGLSTEAKARLAKIIDKACSGPLIKKVGEFIEQGGQDALEAAGSYLREMDARALGPMVGLLESLSNRKARRALCDIMAEQCSGDGSALIPSLGHRYWYVDRNIVMVLGKVADPKTASALGGPLRHEDPRVRREALHALAAIKNDEACDLIRSSFKDSDRQSRILAARLLAELSPEKAYDALMASTNDKGFEDREFEEKKELFELMGRTGGARAVPYLSGMFKKSGFFGGIKKEQARACAAYGLGAAGTPEAAELLKSEIDSKSKLLRTACLAGLRMVKK